jgi:hypothetical protein
VCVHLTKIHKLLIVAVTIVAIVSVLVYNSIRYGRNNALTASCYSNIKTIFLALHSYESEKHCLPPAAIFDEHGHKLHSWRVLILPYIDDECAELYKQYSFDEPWNGPNNRKLFDKCPDCFRCPLNTSDKSTTNYLSVIGPATLWTNSENEPVNDLNCILLLENKSKIICWLEPKDFSIDEAEDIIKKSINNKELPDRHYSYCDWRHGSDLCEIDEWEFGKTPVITSTGEKREKKEGELKQIP